MILFIVLIVLFVLFIIFYVKFIKIPRLNSINFINGTNGSGKSFMSVRYAVGLYKRRVFWQNVRRRLVYYKLIPIKRFYNKWKNEEDILLYSNIPLDLAKAKIKRVCFADKRLKKVQCDCVNISIDLMLRKNYRFNYRSVLLFDEISTIIDQMDFKNEEINKRLTNFFKLFRHETRGGVAIINSQSIKDLHYSVKYVLSQYFYIHSRKKFPLFSILKVQERTYSDAQDTINVNDGDIEEGSKLKCLIVLNKYYKYYDTYCHSWLTDMLVPDVNEKKHSRKLDNMKSFEIWTFKQISYLFENVPFDQLTDWQKKYVENEKILIEKRRLKYEK